MSRGITLHRKYILVRFNTTGAVCLPCKSLLIIFFLNAATVSKEDLKFLSSLINSPSSLWFFFCWRGVVTVPKTSPGKCRKPEESKGNPGKEMAQGQSSFSAKKDALMEHLCDGFTARTVS